MADDDGAPSNAAAVASGTRPEEERRASPPATTGAEPALPRQSAPQPRTPPDELEQAAEVFRRRFPHSSGILPYYFSVGRALLPPDWQRPALVVPLDGQYVVEEPVTNRPLRWLEERFARDLPAFRQLLAAVMPTLDPGSLPRSDLDGKTPFFPNSFFGPMDAAALTGLLAMLRPRRYVEIGSGMSTRFARRAVEQYGLSTQIVCIDPAPRSSVAQIADEVIPESVLDVDLSLFRALEPNDILFFDGSHLSFSGTDCPRFFLEILPAVARGVYIQIHDIFLPDEYPERIRNRFYNEQQLLGAFLLFNREFEVVLPVHHLHALGHCPEGVSFWIRRVESEGLEATG
jgi:hypothetical protein